MSLGYGGKGKRSFLSHFPLNPGRRGFLPVFESMIPRLSAPHTGQHASFAKSLASVSGACVRYLLDMKVCIQAMRGTGSVVRTMSSKSPAELAVSSVTSYELYTGAEKYTSPDAEREKIEQFLSVLIQLDFNLAAAKESARIRSELEARGEMIGPYDVLIAGHAVSLTLILVSDNASEFSRVTGLALENWKVT